MKGQQVKLPLDTSVLPQIRSLEMGFSCVLVDRNRKGMFCNWHKHFERFKRHTRFQQHDSHRQTSSKRHPNTIKWVRIQFAVWCELEFVMMLVN